MQFELAHPTCPLCKLQSSATAAVNIPDTRLCAKCQAMVLMAFRGANSMVATSMAAAPAGGAVARVESNAPELNPEELRSPKLFEDTATDARAFEQEAHSAIEFEGRDDLRFEFFDEDSNIRLHSNEADSSAVSENGSSHRLAEFSGGLAQPIGITDHPRDHEHIQADASIPATPPPAFAAPALDSASPSLVEDRGEELPAVHEEAVTDPWAAPLPAWDYSHSEWPVLVGPGKQKSFRKLKNSIAAIVVVAAAAAFYFLIYRPSTPDSRAATDSGTTARVSVVAEPNVSASGSTDSDAHKGAVLSPAADTNASAASQPAQPVAREAVTSNETSNAQGRFSLQAAAFPTQGDADEFAEKLKRAGVPSYVVPTELGRRGRWFRVRVGRFNAAEEAQRFAGEAQQRARAAGLALQLIVCQYDQP